MYSPGSHLVTTHESHLQKKVEWDREGWGGEVEGRREEEGSVENGRGKERVGEGRRERVGEGRREREERGEKKGYGREWRKGGRTLINIFLTHQSILLFPHILVCL